MTTLLNGAWSATHLAIVALALLTASAGVFAQGVPEAPVTTPTTPAAAQPETKTPETAPDLASLSPADKLKAAARLYANAKTYQDTGLVQVALVQPTRTVVDKLPFSTAFERGGRFRFESRSNASPGEEPNANYVVWSSDNKTFHSWWDLTKELEEFDSLDAAMPFGVSHGSAAAIPPLLNPDMKKMGKITNLKEPVDRGTEVIDGVRCSVIEGKGRAGMTVTLWLDERMALRKTFDSYEMQPGFRTDSTITFTPTFDQPIAAKDFEFTPPKQEVAPAPKEGPATRAPEAKPGSAPSTQTQALPAPDPARGEPVAWIRDHYVYPGDPDKTTLVTQIIRPLFSDFAREHGLAPTPAQLASFQRSFSKEAPDKSPEAEAAMKEIATQFVSQWLIDKALYERYGGTVIFQQANPFEPVGAYRLFLEDHERRGTFKIFDAAQREAFWSYFIREHPMQVPKEDVDFSKPWWEKMPARGR